MANVDRSVIANHSMQFVWDRLVANIDARAVILPSLNNLGLVQPGIKSIDLPEVGDITVVARTDNSEATPSNLTHAVSTLALNLEPDVPFVIGKSASEQSRIALLETYIERATTAIVLDMEEKAITEIKNVSSSAPDHIIQLGSGGTALTEANILDAKELLDAQDVPDEERFLAVNPAQYKDMLGISNFVKAQDYGAGTPIANGEIGEVYGFRVLKTTKVANQEVLAYHRDHAYWGMQSGIDLMTADATLKKATEYSLSTLWGVKTVKSGVRGVLLNATGS